MINDKFENTFEYKLIYIFRINDHNHKDCLKIGDATIKTSKKPEELIENCHELNFAARKRIDEYTSTAGIVYQLLHTELAVYKVNDINSKNYGKLIAFRDYHVHDILKRSNIKVKYFDTNKKQNEWFIVDLNTAKNAIKCVKNGKKSLSVKELTTKVNPIVFRPEQLEAINKTIKRFEKQDRMLWNAKMRFGKTLSTLQVAKEMNFAKTIIITHRPVVRNGWYDDFKKIFFDKPEYSFGSKIFGEESIAKLIESKRPFVYFASIQDLRGSALVGGKFDKNNEIFNVNWDFIVVDEAHEGTQTSLGKAVLEELIKNTKVSSSKILELSGTPFNLLTDFDADSIYTWDYIMEQEAKNDWRINHFGDSNPYEELPKMNIYTYHLEKMITGFMDVEDKAFNFKEFFRVWTGDVQKDGKRVPNNANIGDFVHENDIVSFLNLICKESEKTNYPFSTEEYRNFFRHTLWILPGVKEAKAMSKLLKSHHIFSNFDIVNVAGDGDEEVDTNNALKAVKDAMTKHPENTYTITLSCGRLTTGVSVPEWTAVLMLAGSYSTQASQYLQTIFRVQTPANINGKIKENCYVFDFAPDRTLKMIAESVQLSSKTKKKNAVAEQQLQLFINFCPVISIDGSSMKEFKVAMLLQELKKAYAERVIRNGFDDSRLYNDELMKLDDIALDDFEKLKEKIGKSQKGQNANNVVINDEGFTDEEFEEVEKVQKKAKKTLSVEEKRLLEEYKKKKENRKKAILILRAISIRMPLLVYGMAVDIDTEINIENFVDLVDDLSWKEFMPEGVDKSLFRKFIKYYDKDMFIACARRIRFMSKTCDELEPTERVKKLTELLSSFKNPDKETVLTPWKVVNLHLSKTIGGYCFFDEEFDKVLEEPRYVSNELTSKEIFENKDCKILEINSKTGLYPLYVTYSLYRKQCEELKKQNLTFEEKMEIWKDVLQKNVYIICKTPMAKYITQRTLCGYNNFKINAHAFDDLLVQMSEKQDKLVKKITSNSFWNKGGSEMKFNAVVGNPPYQGVNHQQIYPYFYLTSIKVGQIVSLIFPVGWQEPKNANNLSKLNNEVIKTDRQIVFIDNRQNVFPGITGAEWTNIILWKKGYNNLLDGLQLVYTDGVDPQEKALLWKNSQIEKPLELVKMAEIVKEKQVFASMASATSVLKPYGLRTDVISNSDAENYRKYKIQPLFKEKQKDDDIKIYAKSGLLLWVPSNYQFPKITKSFSKYKVFVPYAWGNMSESSGLGGAFSDIIIGFPNEACTETYLESGSFDCFNTAKKHAKYLFTKFARALLYLNKFSQHSTTSWDAIPIQDYSEDWWDKSISEIDEYLFDKYNIPNEIRIFVRKNIQTKSETNIVNFSE